MNHPGVERGVRAKKRPHRFGGNIPAAREGDMRMKRPQLGLESRLYRGFLYSLVQLEKMGMPGPDPDPKNVRASLGGKRPETGKGQEERFPRDGLQIPLERLLDFSRDVAEKAESQMHLLWREPPNAAQLRVQFRETFCYRVRRLDADEEPFRGH